MSEYDLIKKRREQLGMSYSDLSQKTGFSTSVLYRYENGDTKKIPIDRIKIIAKALNLDPYSLYDFDQATDELGKSVNSKITKIPVLGTVRAGIPMEAVENIIDYEEISEDMARQGEFFALQIKGDSMEPKISEGDVVIVRKQSDVDSGNIAIVLVNGEEATIKKIQKFDGGINLIPSNPSYDVRTYTNDQIESLPVQILGKVVELRAKFA